MQEFDFEDEFRKFMVDITEDEWLKDRNAKGGCLFTAGRLDAAREIWEKYNEKEVKLCKNCLEEFEGRGRFCADSCKSEAYLGI